MTYSKEQEFLLLAVQRSLCEDERQRRERLCAEALDWQYIQRQAAFHRIGPLIYHHCFSQANQGDHIPSEVRQYFQDAYQQTYLQNRLLYQQLNLLLPEFEKHNCRPIVLKGIFLAKYIYQNIALRPMHDIDLLLQQQDANTAVQILKNAGYSNILNHIVFLSDWHQFQEDRIFRELESQGFHLPIFIKKLGAFNVCVELHHHITPILDAQQIDSMPVSGFNGPVRTLSPEYFLLHLCFHVYNHFQKESSSYLLWYYDIVEFIHTYYFQDSSMSWKRFLVLCQQIQIEEEVFRSLAIVHTLFKVAVPEKVLTFPWDFQELLIHIFSEPKPNPEVSMLRSVLAQRKSFGLRYLWDCLFPSKAFLVARYNIRPRWLVYLYYPVRLFKALSRGGRLIKVLFTNDDKNVKKRM
ncbi:hypothetical protein U27_03023 [Candidatus Vecturithrix granuli]|uniref:Nucleotidyltransferase family protein n=1 Tax=Vecturithrix granuli TaxID=1499967 RepID=A0A081BUQ6_VECG1|nr:hypothetical protein U27_03023 [Candidatus Vecturithrix granuli]